MKQKTAKKMARIVLGGSLIMAGMSHLTWARKAFRAQVPDALPLPKDDMVLYSGLVEIALGCGLVFTDDQYQQAIGKVAAAFFTAVFPGNLAQYVHHRNAFGLDTDRKRFIHLWFQPVLVVWALASSDKL